MRSRIISTVILGVIVSSCDTTGPAPMGALLVSVSTTGMDLDLDGYTLEVGSKAEGGLPVNGTAVIGGLPAGRHTLWLRDVAENCSVSGDNPRTVSVMADGVVGDTSQTLFEVACVSTTGALEVRAVTSGSELDPDGYTVVVRSYCDTYPSCEYTQHPVGVNGVVTIASIPIGDYAMLLDGVARNCSLGAENERFARVESNDTASVAFAVTCAQTGALQLSVATTGGDADPQYSVRVRGPRFDTTAVVTATTTVVISNLPAGDYDLGIDDVAVNCDVAGPESASATVPSGGTAVVGFTVACQSFGTLQIAAVTTGVDFDADGYTFQISGERLRTSGTLLANETVTISEATGGDYTVLLDSVSANCDVTSPNPATVSVPSGGMGAIAFDVSCAAAAQLAVTIEGSAGNVDVYLVKTSGAGLTRLTGLGSREAQPAWSPDGGRIVFVSDRDGDADIYLMNADGSGQVPVTDNQTDDSEPEWSPDGSKIAFVSKRDGNVDIYVMQADGANPRRLTTSPAVDTDPTWSPDGSRIAFTSHRDGNAEIYVMDADGGGPTRLTWNGGIDQQPAWSPDGSQLAFFRGTGCWGGVCQYDLDVMNVDGSGITRITSGWWDVLGSRWSPDSRWIAFGVTSFDWDPGDCNDLFCQPDDIQEFHALVAVRVSDGRVAEIAPGAFEPAWRP